MCVSGRLVDARCVEAPPQTTARSESHPREPLELELVTSLHDLFARVEARQGSSRRRARRSKKWSTKGGQLLRMRHCSVLVQVDREEVANRHHRRNLVHEIESREASVSRGFGQTPLRLVHLAQDRDLDRDLGPEMPSFDHHRYLGLEMRHRHENLIPMRHLGLYLFAPPPLL